LTVLEICLLDDALAGRLCHATRPSRRVRLGACEYQTVASAHEVSRAPWEGLRRWSGERAWQVHFVTPMCVRRGNRTSPWPAPESIACGLAERWHRLDPTTAPPLPVRGASAIWVSDVDGKNEVRVLTRRIKHGARWRLTEEVISGFTGRIRYVCDHGTEAEAADFGALLAFAAYGGAGSHTTYGFGVLRPEPTWQPPTVRPGPS
jgi:CRISPR-associated endoribonuclease Cas6